MFVTVIRNLATSLTGRCAFGPLTIWIAASRLLNRTGEQSIVDHYKQVYAPDAPGWLAAQASLKKLSAYAKAHNIRILRAFA